MTDRERFRPPRLTADNSSEHPVVRFEFRPRGGFAADTGEAVVIVHLRRAGSMTSTKQRLVWLVRSWVLITAGLMSLQRIETRAAIGKEPTTRPNIIFLYTDDQAPTALAYANNPQIHTPNLDRLAGQGAYLENAFVTTPVCSPSRASLLTSRYATELGIDDWIHPRLEQELGLDPAWTTWPELLQQAGYYTALIGKWHLGTADRFHPTRQGYDTFFGFREGGTRPQDPLLESEGKRQAFSGLTVDILTHRALELIGERAGKGPFLLSLHFRAPHAAWLPVAPEDWQPYAQLDPQLPDPEIPHLQVERVKRMTREYMASVSGVDRNVGRILEALKQQGIEDETIVIFTSDHGYHLGHHGLWYKGNAQWQLSKLPPQRWKNIPPKQRPNLLDQAIRVPAIVRWPGVIRPGTRVTHVVSNLDWFPTILEMSRTSTPRGVALRGHSIVPLLKGQSTAWSNDLYCQYNMRHGAKTAMRCLREPGWKLMIDFLNEGRRELYDLTNDPGEKVNLADSSDPKIQATLARLTQKLTQQRQLIGDTTLGQMP